MVVALCNNGPKSLKFVLKGTHRTVTYIKVNSTDYSHSTEERLWNSNTEVTNLHNKEQ